MKLFYAAAHARERVVAPPVGAWIETDLAVSVRRVYRCRAPRGRVD